MAVPSTSHYRKALSIGNTLGRRQPHLHWVYLNQREGWAGMMKRQGWRVVAVETAEDATPLTRVEMTKEPTVILLGHEHEGLPRQVLDVVDDRIEIPMVGVGASLNVAVAGSLVLYRLAGLS